MKTLTPTKTIQVPTSVFTKKALTILRNICDYMALHEETMDDEGMEIDFHLLGKATYSLYFKNKLQFEDLRVNS